MVLVIRFIFGTVIRDYTNGYYTTNVIRMNVRIYIITLIYFLVEQENIILCFSHLIVCKLS